MKKFRRIFVWMIAGWILAMPACNKEELLTNRELLLNHPWHFSKATTTSTDPNVQQAVTLVQALLTNSVLTFHDDGTYIFTALNDSDTGTWSLSADETMLIMDNEDPGKIVTLTEEEFALEGTETDDQLGTYTVTLWWIK